MAIVGPKFGPLIPGIRPAKPETHTHLHRMPSDFRRGAEVANVLGRRRRPNLASHRHRQPGAYALKVPQVSPSDCCNSQFCGRTPFLAQKLTNGLAAQATADSFSAFDVTP